MTSLLGPYRILRHGFEIVLDGPAGLVDVVRTTFGPLKDRSSTVDCTYAIRRDGEAWMVLANDEMLRETSVPGKVLPALISQLNRAAVASTPDHLVLHGGLIASPSAGSVGVVAASGSGKSTIVASALAAGWSYGGDEHLAIQHDSGLVEPVPKPISLKPGATSYLSAVVGAADTDVEAFLDHQRWVAAAELGADVMTGHARLTQVLLVSWDPGTTPTRAALTPADALMALRSHCFNFEGNAGLSFRTLAHVARTVPVHRFTYGDAASAVRLLGHYSP